MNVSIIMSVYNETPGQVVDAIESILRQTYPINDFIIVLDNPKNKKLLMILKKYEENYEEINLFVNESNMGLARSLNKAASLARFEVLGRMDADDIAVSTRIAEEVEKMLSEDLDVVSTNVNYMNELGTIIGKKTDLPECSSDIKKLLQLESVIMHPTVIMKKSIFQKVGGYRILPTAEDYDLWLRIDKIGGEFGIINKPLLNYRSRTTSMTSNYWRTYVVSKYARKTYKNKRISEDEMNKILLKWGIANSRKERRFNDGQTHFEKAIKEFRDGKRQQAVYQIVRSALFSKDNFINVIRYVCYRILLFRMV